jgi:hypothetical protein
MSYLYLLGSLPSYYSVVCMLYTSMAPHGACLQMFLNVFDCQDWAVLASSR